MRAVPFRLPFRSRRQFRQLQFHCGNPPPAAEPSTCTNIVRIPTSCGVDRAEFEQPGSAGPVRRWTRGSGDPGGSLITPKYQSFEELRV